MFRVSADDGQIAELAANLFAAYARATTSEPELDYQLRLDGVYCGDRRISSADHPLDVVPGLELALFSRILERSDDVWLLHAASVVIDGACIVLVGPSGAGKSTAALVALEQLNAGYVTDEHTAITAAAMVTGIPRPLAFGAPPDTSLWRTVYPIRRSDGAVTDHILLHPKTRSVVHEPVPVRAFAYLRYVAGASRSCQRISTGKALPLLWQQSMNTGAQVLRTASAVLSRVPCYEVVSSTTTDIRQSLCELLGAVPPTTPKVLASPT